MAAILIPSPGTEYGPCETDCEHRDCRASREDAALLCERCGEPIGYDRRCYIGDREHPEHALCLEIAIEAGDHADGAGQRKLSR